MTSEAQNVYGSDVAKQMRHRPDRRSFERQDVWTERTWCVDARGTGKAVARALRIEAVQHDKRQVQIKVSQRVQGPLKNLGDGLRIPQAGGQTQYLTRAALAEHAQRCLGHGMEKPADLAALITNGTQGKSEECFFEVVVPVQEHPLIFTV